MRLYLLPISTRRALVYCQRSNVQVTAQSSYVDRVTHKAAETWAKWEEHEKGWQKKVTEYGNKALQRIPFEEWGLKSIPSLSQKRKAEDIKGRNQIQVVYPGNVLKAQEIQGLLRRLGTERQQLHRQRAWGSVVASPFTIPFGLIPILPNLPFFYLVYRAWSHFRALWGSQHLEFLADKELLQPTSSPFLERLYAAKGRSPAFENASSTSTANTKEHLLLDETAHHALAKGLNVPELAVEVERAVWQVRKALQERDASLGGNQVGKTTDVPDPAKTEQRQKE